MLGKWEQIITERDIEALSELVDVPALMKNDEADKMIEKEIVMIYKAIEEKANEKQTKVAKLKCKRTELAEEIKALMEERE